MKKPVSTFENKSACIENVVLSSIRGTYLVFNTPILTNEDNGWCFRCIVAPCYRLNSVNMSSCNCSTLLSLDTKNTSSQPSSPIKKS